MDKLWQAVLQTAQQAPGRIAVMDAMNAQNNRLLYSELAARVTLLADELSLRHYASLALYACNSADWIIADLACRLANIVLLPLPRFFSPGQLTHALRSVPVDAVLVDRAAELQLAGFRVERVADLSVNLTVLRLQKVIVADKNMPEICEHADTDTPVSAEPALPPFTRKMTFTSGSTGDPKGVCLSAEHQLQTALALADATASLNIKKHLSVMPYSTLLENVAGIYTPLLCGATIVTATDDELGFNGAAGLTVSNLLNTIDRVQPDSMILMPQLLQALVLSAIRGWQVPGSLRFIAVGGGSVPRSLLDRAWELGLPVFEGYGLSECGSVVALNTPAERRNGSVGKVLPHAGVKIADEELYVKNAVFLGYAGDVSSWSDMQNKAWFRTGDLFEADADGFLYFRGRRKNILVSTFGRNISPEWVENEITAEPAIAQAFVFGDNRPFCVALVAVRRTDVSDADITNAISSANKRLPAYARIRHWLRLPHAIPAGTGSENDLMTTNGRPRRGAIEAYFRHDIEALFSNDEENSHAV